MRFDFLSFLIGFAIAAGIGFILFRYRRTIQSVRESAQTQAGSTRKLITSSAESRYYGDLVKTLDSYHVAGDIVRLRDIYVEPHFIRGVEPSAPDAESKDIFHVIPMIHDMPFSYAQYNVETLSVNDLRAGEQHLALLGLPGSGKSVALALIGLYAAGEIDFQTLDVISEQIFEDETRDLSPDEKERVIKQRRDTQQRALEHLQTSQARKAEEGTLHPTADFQSLMPILINLRDLDLRPEVFGVQSNGKGPVKRKALDPAEPLVKALQKQYGVVTGNTLPRLTYRRLNAGTCIVLIDGYEDIAPEDRPEKLRWLQEFINLYRSNFIIVTGPAVGFDPLLNLGLTPIFIRAWSESNFTDLAGRWAVAWPTIAGTPRKPAPIPEERIVRRIATGNRARLPMDVTLKAWAALSGDEQEAGRRGWYDFCVRYRMKNKDVRPVIERIAAEILNQGGRPVTREQIKAFITEMYTGQDGKVTVNVDDLIGKVTSQEIFTIWPDGSYGFSHPLITAFLASEALTNLDVGTISTLVMNPSWDLALAFASGKLPLVEAVAQRLGSAPDLLYTGLFSVVPWLPDSSPNAPWRAEVFKRLTAALLAPAQYPIIRERAMAALVASRDKNVMFIFRQGLRATDTQVRRLSVVGLGALGETDAIKDLGGMLTDPDQDVQLAAGMALGAIGSEAALETMLGGLVEGEQALRQAVAEALAAVPGEGHAVLRDAMSSQDMMVRRAAVFGLARIKAAWALSLLYRSLLEDEQWYVRNAAEEAFLNAEGLETGGALRHPEADSLTWLVSWAAQRGEGVPAGQNARQVLIRVLQEGEPPLRASAAQTLANLGHMPALKPLYSALKDRDEKVRGAVYDALGKLQNRVGEKFPAVM